MKTLVLGLGNDLIADDAVGVLAARALCAPLSGIADVVDTALHGIALLEFFIGYDCAIVVDAIQTGSHPVGTVHRLSPADFDSVPGPSPHFTGLPELITIASQLGLDFPKDFRILALEVEDIQTIGGGLTPKVREALPELIECVRQETTRVCSFAAA